MANPEAGDRNCQRPGMDTVWAAILLQIEVNVMPGQRVNSVLTGQLGDVMKESAQAGISYIRSIC